MTDSARTDWRARIYRSSGDASAVAGVEPAIPAVPRGLRATAGAGHVTLEWEPVEGAIGYLVHRGESPDGPFSSTKPPHVDVAGVPATRYADTAVTPGRTAHYVVAALGTMDVHGEFSAPVAATPHDGGDHAVAVGVDAGRVTRPLPRPWRPMIGSEHLSHMLSAEETGGRPIGAELAAALRLAREELGVRAVRAHAILGDDLGVYREVDGAPVHDFTGVDRVYDTLTGLGLRPVVELGYMPRDLAADPSKTVFDYRAIISPPKDYDRWGDLVHDLVHHLADRYGLAELVAEWSFEVWNEANLEVFWSGTPEEYLRLYDVTAAAVKNVHPDLRVGGPASAANGWVEELVAHTVRSGASLDFVSTHTYGNAPLDWRPVLARYGKAGTPIWWTEWGPTPTHFHGVGDGPFGAAFVLHGMRSAAGRVEALSHWVASDHFEELGRPPRLFHGGFGLLTVGNLRKPRYLALVLAERLGDHELAVEVTGDAGGVEAWAARHDDGRAGALVWNGTLDHAKAGGAPILGRRVTLTFAGLADREYVLTHHRVDRGHSDIEGVWASMGGGDWPTTDQWAELRARNTLDELHPPATVRAERGTLTTAFDLPMPGVSYVEARPR
ncbi:GH39 family glycosyl hydrolase [Sphaerisporangium aureirubrum]|uniref:Glycosyl hydrolases family 39 N-terminal catalytic domain-containing protein n=1 Tax=Sphaerisporangium aureirubrum TaxID=1544736 RepID=A0ABW1NMD0_9ACTN